MAIGFAAGASLELFMNYFHVGEANIYKSIEKRTSDSIAQSRFDMERFIFEEFSGSQQNAHADFSHPSSD